MDPYKTVSDRVKKLVNENEGAVVFDIDETLITGREYEGRIFFIKQAQGKLRPIKEMIDLHNWIQQQGRKTFIITARRPHMMNVTVENLKKAGLRGQAKLYMKPIGMDKVEFKSGVRRHIELDTPIIANIGDQQTDLDGGHSMETFLLPSTY